MGDVLLDVDLGTTGTKTALFTVRGEPVAEAFAATPLRWQALATWTRIQMTSTMRPRARLAGVWRRQGSPQNASPPQGSRGRWPVCWEWMRPGSRRCRTT